MEINLNNNGLGGIRMGNDAFGPTGIGAGRETQGTSSVDAGRETRDAVTITNAPSGLASAEPVADIPDAALSRDDALGKLVSAAFSLPPPPMPAFVD